MHYTYVHKACYTSLLVYELQSYPFSMNDSEYNSELERFRNILLSLPEELWGEVIDKVSQGVCWFRHSDTLHINLALRVKEDPY